MKIILTILSIFILHNCYAQPYENDTISDFTVIDVHGETHNLYSYLDNNKFVTIDFFGIDCQPCINLVSVFNQVYNTYGCNQADVIFLAINYDNYDGELLQFEQEQGGNFPSVSGINGGGGQVYLDWGIQYFPQLLLIKPDKTVAANINPITLLNIDSVYNAFEIYSDSCDISSIDNPYSTVDYLVYPNPVIDKIYLELNIPTLKSIKFHINNIVGNTVILGNLYKGEKFIDVANLDSGIYFLNVFLEGRWHSKKIVVKR